MTEQIQQEAADWIDKTVIASDIIEALKKEGIEVTTENVKKVWLDILYTEMPDALNRSVSALAEKGEILYV